MPATLDDVEALFDAVKRLRDERRKMAKLSERAASASLGRQYQKASADLHWQAMHVLRLEQNVHALAVNCGVADLREPEHYRATTMQPDGWHTYKVNPVLPRCIEPTATA